MIMKILKKTLRLMMFGYKGTSKTYINGLKKRGAIIGEDVTIYDSINTVIDDTQAWLLTIGNHVKITGGVVILTHDYSWSVLKNMPFEYGRGSILGANSAVKIGNNVFIGMNSIILRGVTIGNNVIIGAGSIVSTDCEDNSVYAGNPAKKIMSLEEYYQKRKERQRSEIENLAKNYYDRYKKIPSKEIFHEYFMAFSSWEEVKNENVFRNKMRLGTGEDSSKEYLIRNERLYSSYEDFITKCNIKGME